MPDTGPGRGKVPLRAMVGATEGLVLHHSVRARCSYHWSLLEDLSDIIGDLQHGHLRSSHTLNAVKEEVLAALSSDRLLRNAFPAEIESLTLALDNLFGRLPPSPKDQFAQLKSRKTECRRAAMAAQRLHHRCARRRVTREDMTWTGVGGLIAADLFQEVLAEKPDFGRIDRLVNQFLLDSLYRGYNINYLTTLFDRYLSPQRESPSHANAATAFFMLFVAFILASGINTTCTLLLMVLTNCERPPMAQFVRCFSTNWTRWK